jgi:hypothetical protein
MNKKRLFCSNLIINPKQKKKKTQPPTKNKKINHKYFEANKFHLVDNNLNITKLAENFKNLCYIFLSTKLSKILRNLR